MLSTQPAWSYQLLTLVCDPAWGLNPPSPAQQSGALPIKPTGRRLNYAYKKIMLYTN